MRTSFALLLICFFLSLPAFAQKKFYGTLWDDHAVKMISTSDGGYLLLGYTVFEGNVGLQKIYLVKTDANGDSLWTNFYSVDFPGIRPYDVCEVPGKNTYAICGNLLKAGRTYNPFIMTVDDEGQKLLFKVFDDTIGKIFYEILPDSSTGFILNNYHKYDSKTGIVFSRITKINDSNLVEWHLDSVMISNIVKLKGKDNFVSLHWPNWTVSSNDTNNRVQKFTSEGKIIFSKVLLTDKIFTPTRIIEDNNQDLVIIGYADTAVVLFKLNNKGDTVLSKKTGRYKYRTYPYDIKQDRDSNYIVLATWQNSWGYDFQVLKFDRHFNLLNVLYFPRYDEDETPRSLEIEEDGNYALFGEFTNGGIGKTDLLFARTDTAGKLIVTGLFPPAESLNDKGANFFTLFPNPSENVICLDARKTFSGHAELFNAAGKMLSTINIANQDKIYIALSDLQKGNYFLRIFNQKNRPVETHKFLKL
jgi:hypothetical protein